FGINDTALLCCGTLLEAFGSKASGGCCGWCFCKIAFLCHGISYFLFKICHPARRHVVGTVISAIPAVVRADGSGLPQRRPPSAARHDGGRPCVGQAAVPF